MSEIHNVITNELAKTTVTYKRFQAILIRLLEYGSICYGDSQIETELYNEAVRVIALLQDYFAVLGCRLIYERSWRYFRLYPPGADIPGLAQLDKDEIVDGLHSSLTIHETAAVLILGFLYRDALQQGRLDENGEAQICLEAFYTALQNLMKRHLPVSISERKTIFKKLRQLKLIKYHAEEDLENHENWIVIRPMINSIIQDENLKALIAPADDQSEEVL